MKFQVRGWGLIYTKIVDFLNLILQVQLQTMWKKKKRETHLNVNLKLITHKSK